MPEKAWHQNRKVRFAVLGAVLVAAGIFAAPKAMHAYDRWAGKRAIRSASEYLAKGDMQHAMLQARRAIELNPLDPEAHRIIAQTLEAAGSPDALHWRQRLGSLVPGDAENLIAQSMDALVAGYRDTAAELLASVKPEDRNSAQYHDVAARIAIVRRDVAEAETHWKEAARLAPNDDRYKLNLAVLQRNFGGSGDRMEALDALGELGAKAGTGRAAQMALLADAMARGDSERAKTVTEGLATRPDAAFRDRLVRLSALHALKDPEFSNVLAELREGAVTKPEDLYELLLWMNGHDLALLVLDWLPELPPDVVAKPPVCVAVADAHARGLDWKKLLAWVESGSWGGFEFARLAYKARALERTDDRVGSEEAWKGAVAVAETRPGQIESLAKLAFGWRWQERGMDALRKLTASGSAPRWALDALWVESAKQGDTGQLRLVSKLRVQADPRSVEARNNFACLSLLTHSKEGGMHELAEALHKEAPGNPSVVATHALSLYQRGRIEDALRAIRTLKPDQLRQPGAARYHGIFLTAAGRAAEAEEWLKLGEKGIVLPEEKALIVQAKAAAKVAEAKSR